MARLLSVNVGATRHRVARETVHTAVWKTPVPRPTMTRRLNIDGDGQGDLAGHGGEHRAVFVYQIDSYAYWQAQLGRSDFSYGQFGENFTVDGLPDGEVCIGDRYRIGSAVFEVTQPRVICYMVGEPGLPGFAAIAKWLVRSGGGDERATPYSCKEDYDDHFASRPALGGRVRHTRDLSPDKREQWPEHLLS